MIGVKIYIGGYLRKGYLPCLVFVKLEGIHGIPGCVEMEQLIFCKEENVRLNTKSVVINQFTK
jgi:hypothetical protein